MADVFELYLDATPFRVRYDPHVSESFGTCLLIQSGHLGLFDEPVGEALLHERLVESLTQ